MRHAFLDATSALDSPIHRLDARAKILGILAAVVICVSTPPQNFLAFGAYFSLAWLLVFLARLPFGLVLKRIMLVMPFVILVAAFVPFLKADAVGGGYSLGLGGATVSKSGLLILWNTTAKAVFGVMMIVLLSGTTPFPKLLLGFRRLYCPEVIIMILSFTYRYLFVLTDELMRMKTARDSRGYHGRWLWQAKTVGRMIGVFFLRSYTRAERIYIAMISRGYDGRQSYLTPGRMGGSEAAFIMLFLGAMLSARMVVTR